jgi:transcriptional regulator with XRE-family HTH domain
MVYREIGKRIQQAREESGLTQEELAAKLGFPIMNWAKEGCT